MNMKCVGLGATALLVACAPPLLLQSATPTGEQNSTPTQVELRFDRAILGADGASAQGLNLVISPPVRGHLRHPAPNVVQFEFAEALPPAQTYRVVLQGGLRSADGEAKLRRNIELTFTTPRNGFLALERIAGGDSPTEVPSTGEALPTNLDLHDRLLVRLRYPETTATLEKLVRVMATPMAGGSSIVVPVALMFPTGQASDRFLVSATANWPKHATLDVELAAGLGVTQPGAGALRTQGMLASRAATYGPSGVVAPPLCDRCKPPKTLVIGFSTAVTCADVLPFIHLTPSDDLQCTTQPSRTQIRLEPLPALASLASYELVIDEALTDVFGQRLNERKSYTLTTGDATPRFAHQKMFNVLERQQGGAHEEKVYGAATLEVSGSRLALQDAWRVIASQNLASQVAWKDLPWWLEGNAYEYSDDLADCYWDAALEEEVCSSDEPRQPGEVTQKIEIPQAKVVNLKTTDAKGWSRVQVPLDGFLEGKGGIVLFQATALDANSTPLAPPVLRLVNVTDIGLSAKVAPHRLMVLAASLATGQAITGAEAQLYVVDATTGGLRSVATATTDAQGLAVFASEALSQAQAAADLHRDGFLVSVSQGDDGAFLWSSFASGGRRVRDAESQLVGSVYTERGVYRPGETVFYRVVARRETAAGFALPEGDCGINVQRLGEDYDSDDDADVVHSAAALFSRFGTTHGSFVVPANARVGTYRIKAAVGTDALEGHFKVAEFRRAEMKVNVQTHADDYVLGDTLKATLTADYLFGAPAGGLKVRWSLRPAWEGFASRRFPNARFTDYSYHTWGGDGGYDQFLDEGTGVLDEHGSFRLSRKLQDTEARGRMERLIVSATVDDANGQSVSARKAVRVHPAALHVGILPHGYLKDLGQRFTYEVVAVSNADDALDDVEVTVESVQDYWYSVQRKGPSGHMYWTSAREEIKQAEVCKGKTDSQGKLACQFMPTKGGSLRLRVRAQDKQGRVVNASEWFWITGDASYYGGRENTHEVGVIPDAEEVDAGNAMRIVVTSPFRDALALVTVEREDILWQKVQRIGTNTTLEIPVAKEWVPNVHVSVTAVRGRITPEGDLKPDPERDKPAYALGYARVKVRPTRHVLQVAVSTDRKGYEPQDKVTATVRVRDVAGQGVASEVNLFAVDEGVLMLTGYRTPNLITTLFRERPYTVLALDTRMHVLGERRYITPVIKGEEDGGGGGEAADDDDLRKDFNPVAVWVGSLLTDEQGQATSTFAVPDTLTTYRLMAVAVEHSRFGSGDAEFQVNKTLMLRQAVPRFLRPGDRAQAGVLVNHLLEAPQDVTVELTRLDEGLFTVHGERRQTVHVPAKATVAVRFDIEAHDRDGVSDIVFAGTMDKFRDSVQLPLPVRRLQAREAVAIAGVLEKGDISHTLVVPEGARPEALTVNVSALPVAALEERMRHLVQYPYGCLEQRTSVVLPLIAIRELARELNFASIPQEKIKGWVEEWVGLVPKYACSDGGFDYYPGCAAGSNPYLTSYAIDGLLTARRFGYAVPDAVVAKPAAYLAAQFGQLTPQSERAQLSAALRVLAELQQSTPAYENALFEARADLPTFAKADIARAIARRAGNADDRVRALLSEIATQAVTADGAVYYRSAGTDRYWWAWDSDRRATAVVLRTLLDVAPTDARIPLIVKGLVDLDDDDHYLSTQGVAQSLLALAEAVSVLKRSGTTPQATVLLAVPKATDRKLFDRMSVGQQVLSATVGPDALGTAGPYGVMVQNSGDGPLYFGGFLRYAFPATARLAAKDEGFHVERTYTDRVGKPLSEKVRVGDFVMVNLTIRVNENGRMVVVDDPLPAGLEPVDTTLETSDSETARVMQGRDGGWWRSRYRELRDDRTEYHFRQVWAWKEWPLKLSYLTRATTPGQYYAPGTTVERMYQPHIRGRGRGADLVVVP